MNLMSWKTRREVYRKSNGGCWYCGTALDPLEGWEIEHATPRARGGTDDLENLMPACRRCNSRKGERTVEEFRAAIEQGLRAELHAAAQAISRVCDLDEEFGGYALGGLKGLSVSAVNLMIVFYGEGPIVRTAVDPRLLYSPDRHPGVPLDAATLRSDLERHAHELSVVRYWATFTWQRISRGFRERYAEYAKASRAAFESDSPLPPGTPVALFLADPDERLDLSGQDIPKDGGGDGPDTLH